MIRGERREGYGGGSLGVRDRNTFQCREMKYLAFHERAHWVLGGLGIVMPAGNRRSATVRQPPPWTDFRKTGYPFDSTIPHRWGFDETLVGVRLSLHRLLPQAVERLAAGGRTHHDAAQLVELGPGRPVRLEPQLPQIARVVFVHGRKPHL